MTVTYGIDKRVKVPVWDEEALRPSEREFDKRYYDACTACAEVIRGRSNP
jgi:hypothetical protein